jgi:hypothetical protein
MIAQAVHAGYQPVVIIGAARSGTNMLRNVLARLPGFGTWPCDEINLIWRHGNHREATDELRPEQATPAVQAYVRRAFARLARQRGLSHVVEKTCANSLRVGFVDRILPDAHYVHVVRDGRDVTNSARKRWTAKLEPAYTLRKARFMPLTDLPYYGVRYALNRGFRLFSRGQRLASWGPRFEGMDLMLAEHSLEEVCAVQWQRCVDAAEQSLGQLDERRVYRLLYENFVANPAQELQNVAAFLAVRVTERQCSEFTSGVSRHSTGTWRQELDQHALERVMPWMSETLKRYGYV